MADFPKTGNAGNPKKKVIIEHDRCPVEFPGNVYQNRLFLRYRIPIEGLIDDQPTTHIKVFAPKTY